MDVKCDLCDSNINVKWKCTDCDEWLCFSCKIIHAKSRASREHHVNNLTEYDRSLSVSGDKDKYCPEHPLETFQMYCKNCECLLCLVCVTGKHKQHEFVTLCHIVDKKTREVSKCLETLKTVQLIEMKKSLAVLKETQLDHSEQLTSCIHAVKKQGQAIKKEVDNAISEFISELEQTGADTKEQISRLDDKVSRRIAFIQKRITRCEAKRSTKSHVRLIKLASEMKSAELRCKENSPHWKVAFPTFIPTKMDKQEIQSLFGKVIYKEIDHKASQKRTASRISLHTNIRIISQFNHNIRAYAIATDSESTWICRDTYLAKLGPNGKQLKWVDLKFDAYCVTKTKTGDLFLGSYCKIYKLLKEGIFIEFFNFGLWFATDICITEENDILVCLRNMYIGKEGKVIRLTERGKHVQTIGYDIVSGFLFNWPEYLTCTRSGDIWVTDTKDNCVVVTSADGRLKFRYSGFADILMNQDFQPRALVTNKYDQILIADVNNHAVHLVDKDGHFLQFLLTTHHDLYSPIALGQDEDGTLWIVCDDGKVINVNYLA